MRSSFSISLCGWLLEFEQKLLRRLVAGSSFERCQYAILRFVSLSGGKIGLRQRKLRTGPVDWIRRNQRVVLTNRAVVVLCCVQQLTEPAMQILVFDRVDIIDTLKRGDRLRIISACRFKRRQPFECIRRLATHMLVTRQNCYLRL